jgi:hypothetical protein
MRSERHWIRHPPPPPTTPPPTLVSSSSASSRDSPLPLTPPLTLSPDSVVGTRRTAADWVADGDELVALVDAAAAWSGAVEGSPSPLVASHLVWVWPLGSRYAPCAEPATATLYQRRNFEGSCVSTQRAGELLLWAERQPPATAAAATDGVREHHQQRRRRRRSPASTTPNTLFYRSLSVNAPLRVYFFAYYPQLALPQRLFLLPLCARRSVDNLDAYLRHHLTYSSVYNPFGSGGYLHWLEQPVQFFLCWQPTPNPGGSADPRTAVAGSAA